MSKVPILICIKTRSVRCPRKNQQLLPYVLDWCVEIGAIEDVVVVTDSRDFVCITNGYNIYEYYIEEREDYWDDLMSSYNYCKTHGYNEFILLPVTQPARDKHLIENVLKISLNDFDLVTSYNTMPDRSIFEIEDDHFKVQDTERKGSMCREMKIADGAIYYTSVNFLEKCFNSSNMNKTFWNSNIKFVENNAPFIDIDTPGDLEKYKRYFIK